MAEAVHTRASANAKELRERLGADWSVPAAVCDRLALALGLALDRNRKPPSGHPLGRLAEIWGLSLSPHDREDDDERGIEHNLADIDLDDKLIEAMVVGDAKEGADRRMRLALNHGYRWLKVLLDRKSNADRLLEELVRALCTDPEMEQFVDGRLGPAKLMQVELGTDEKTRERVFWGVNQEDGQTPSANVRIAGQQGMGKSQALIGLLHDMVAEAPGIGFILLDYKGDLSSGPDFEPFRTLSGAKVIRPPNAPVPMNPFDLPASVDRRLAADRFVSTLGTFIRMGPVQEGHVRHALTEAYDQSHQAGRLGPSLREARDAVRSEYRLNGGKDDSVTAALDRLVESPIFSHRTDDFRLEDVFSQRWIVDLAGLGELKPWVAFILIHCLREVADAIGDAPFDSAKKTRALRGIVAIDEAHHYLPRGTKTQPLKELVRVGRSKGIPIFLSSQSLNDFQADTEWKELIATTLLFGHGAPPDVKLLQGALKTDARMAKEVANQSTSLAQFVAFTHHHKDPNGTPRRVRITPFFERVARMGQGRDA
jgi:hypothetical protein